MEIKDLFSHKIHSSGNDWPDKLVELAFLFAEFDGQIFNRDNIEERLLSLSPRSAYVARDRSKFRDEFSAYPAYFGLYRLENSVQGWKIVINETTHQLLLQEEPDVAGFLRLQLSLFQFPNGMGAIHYPGTSKIKVQSNAKDRTLSFIKHGVHLSPLRLIVSALFADAEIRDVPFNHAKVKFSEVFALANIRDLYQVGLPEPKLVKDFLQRTRNGTISSPQQAENRFHLLKHLDLFTVGKKEIKVRDCITDGEKSDVIKKCRRYCQLKLCLETLIS